MFGLGKPKETSPAELLSTDALRRNCSVYMHRECSHFIIATLFGKGIMFELSEEVRTYEGTSDIDLGEVVKERFMASELRPYTNAIRNRRETEWPSFKSSMSKSVAAFNREYIFVSVKGLNEANIMVRLESEPVMFGLSITTLCNPLVVEKLGGELNKIKKQYQKWERP